MQQTEEAARAKAEELKNQMNKEKESAVQEAAEQTKKEIQAETHK